MQTATRKVSLTPSNSAPYGLNVVENCVVCGARQKTQFCHMSAETMRELNMIRQTALYPAGAVLFVEGEAPRGLFVLCGGEAKLTAGSRQGESIILRLAESGELLGLSSLIAGSAYAATAETITPAQVAFIPARKFQRFLRTHPDVALRVAEQPEHGTAQVLGAGAVAGAGPQHAIQAGATVAGVGQRARQNRRGRRLCTLSHDARGDRAHHRHLARDGQPAFVGPQATPLDPHQRQLCVPGFPRKTAGRHSLTGRGSGNCGAQDVAKAHR